ncbi:hypothetical protein X805_36860 [Sphaerotilus natans subsp. natans DSM 6575]|uniref:Uncharacterized protein n=1 Tax=Sphaerotilus natans subsp. natans DSM 6575 TaxID=1286631 RepID=A0A059KHK0_9BURK|nr:hypothetical protein X805_36860 [Sphaerotilus natans subsp. natans DSM 6575]
MGTELRSADLLPQSMTSDAWYKQNDMVSAGPQPKERDAAIFAGCPGALRAAEIR